eukprot:scaffold61878_cov20-Tisochrysis_lutea.AAC.1
MASNRAYPIPLLVRDTLKVVAMHACKIAMWRPRSKFDSRQGAHKTGGMNHCPVGLLYLSEL